MNWIKPGKNVVHYNDIAAARHRTKEGGRTSESSTPVVNLDYVVSIYTLDELNTGYSKDNYRIVFSYGTDDSEIHWYYLNKEARDKDYATLLTTLEASFISIG